MYINLCSVLIAAVVICYGRCVGEIPVRLLIPFNKQRDEGDLPVRGARFILFFNFMTSIGYTILCIKMQILFRHVCFSCIFLFFAFCWAVFWPHIYVMCPVVSWFGLGEVAYISMFFFITECIL